ncbi:hypothetical protein [Henriciella litoralis]|uniref:hypothetical protein n=1 Tax=Henriciella litoralis TaxID=568102 RepID=UPI001F362A69|nr:hypothetical protein [Henriciella litoralis]
MPFSNGGDTPFHQRPPRAPTSSPQGSEEPASQSADASVLAFVPAIVANDNSPTSNANALDHARNRASAQRDAEQESISSASMLVDLNGAHLALSDVEAGLESRLQDELAEAYSRLTERSDLKTLIESSARASKGSERN